MQILNWIILIKINIQNLRVLNLTLSEMFGCILASRSFWVDSVLPMFRRPVFFCDKNLHDKRLQPALHVLSAITFVDRWNLFLNTCLLQVYCDQRSFNLCVLRIAWHLTNYSGEFRQHKFKYNFSIRFACWLAYMIAM